MASPPLASPNAGQRESHAAGEDRAMRRASSLVQPEKYSALLAAPFSILKTCGLGIVSHRPSHKAGTVLLIDREWRQLWASQTCGAWPAHFMAAYSHFGRRYRVVPEIFFWSGCCCAGFETFGVHFPHRISGVATPTRVSAVQVTFRISQSRDSTDG